MDILIVNNFLEEQFSVIGHLLPRPVLETLAEEL